MVQGWCKGSARVVQGMGTRVVRGWYKGGAGGGTGGGTRVAHTTYRSLGLAPVDGADALNEGGRVRALINNTAALFSDGRLVKRLGAGALTHCTYFPGTHGRLITSIGYQRVKMVHTSTVVMMCKYDQTRVSELPEGRI